LSIISDYHTLRRIKRKLILEYEKLEMTKTSEKNYDISHDLSSADFSVTNDDFDVTKSQKIKENSVDIKNSSNSNKVPAKVKSYLGNRRLLKAINQQDST
jgi:hypothetical protein